MILNKKGAGHIEMVLSVILFIVFVGAALFFFSPTNTSSRFVESSMDYALREVENSISSDFEKYGIKLISNPPDLLQIPNVVKINFENLISGGVRVFDEDGNFLDSGRSAGSGDIAIEHLGNSFVYAIVSEDFEYGGLAGGELIVEEYYDVSSSLTKKIISEKKAKSLEARYAEDYDNLKGDFKLSNRVDFKFKLEIPEAETIEGIKQPPQGIEIFTKTKRVEILREDSGEVVYGNLIITIW